MGKAKALILLAFLISCTERIEVVQNAPAEIPAGKTGVWVLTTLSPELWYVGDSALRVLFAGMWANDLELSGDTLFITNSGDNSVLVYDFSAGTLDTLSVGEGRNPWASVYDPRTGRLFVSNFLTHTVTVFENGTLVDEIPVGPNPEGLAVVGDMLYVACTGYSEGYRSRVYVISTDSLSVLDSLFLGVNVQTVFSDPKGDVYALATGDYSSQEGWLFRLRDGRLVDSTFVGGYPADACLSRDGKVYLVGWSGRVTVYDWASERILKSFETHLNLSGCGFKGDTLALLDFSNDLLLLLSDDGSVEKSYSVGDGPVDMVPDVR